MLSQGKVRFELARLESLFGKCRIIRKKPARKLLRKSTMVRKPNPTFAEIGRLRFSLLRVLYFALANKYYAIGRTKPRARKRWFDKGDDCCAMACWYEGLYNQGD